MNDAPMNREEDALYLHVFTHLPEKISLARIALRVADYYFQTNPVTKADLDEFPGAFKHFCKLLPQDHKEIKENNGKVLIILKGLLNLLLLKNLYLKNEANALHTFQG